MATVRCCCSGGDHSAGCGCITDGFIRSARINHFLASVQAEKTAEYARKMGELGKYHACVIHTWENCSCSFHPQLTCSCGSAMKRLSARESLPEQVHSQLPFTLNGL